MNLRRLVGFGFFLLFSLPASAAVLYGQVMGSGMLGCLAPNFTGRPQIVEQIHYEWTCSRSPMGPFYPDFQVRACGYNCRVPEGATYFHQDGPFTANCLVLLGAGCRVYTRDDLH
jgi:hypothetical protein